MTCQEETSGNGVGDATQSMDPIIDIMNCDDDDDYENDPPNATEKKYFCQRCLNHGFNFPRKGHKPKCNYLNCTCDHCFMVERRRQLNNCLSKNRQLFEPRDQHKGPKVRDPQCARCSAHGLRIPLRGHKRSMCQFQSCTCAMCAMVELRRQLMARQIKLRRNQQKSRGDGPVPKTKRTWKKRAAKEQREASTTPTDTSGSSPMSQAPPLSPIATPTTPAPISLVPAPPPITTIATSSPPPPTIPAVTLVPQFLFAPPLFDANFLTTLPPAPVAPIAPPTQFSLLAANPLHLALLSQIIAGGATNFR